MSSNEKYSKRLAKIAGRILKDPTSATPFELKALAASVLTQAEDLCPDYAVVSLSQKDLENSIKQKVRSVNKKYAAVKKRKKKHKEKIMAKKGTTKGGTKTGGKKGC